MKAAWRVLVGLCLATAAWPSGAASQGAERQLIVDSVVATPQGPDGIRLQMTRVLDIEPRQVVEIIASSADFDPVLWVVRPEGDTLWNDDYGAGTSARLTALVPSSGKLTVIVSSLNDSDAGIFTLDARPLGLGTVTVIADSITAESPHTPRNLPYGSHKVRFSAKEYVILSLRADDFDPYLIAVSQSGMRYSNDDTEGLNSGLELNRPEDGEWTIHATALSDDARGPYELTIVHVPSPDGFAGPIQGTLVDGDSVDIFGGYFDRREVPWPSGEPVTVLLESDAFDGFLTVRANGRTYTNDDVETIDRRYTSRVDLDNPGYRITVFVTTFTEGEGGAYRLTISPKLR